ncbi:MAG: hypothetical protein RL701_7568 [Pseudomonadota bacterium]|jgi:hypothetical protein
MDVGVEGKLSRFAVDGGIGHFLNASRQVITVTPTAANAATYGVDITMADGTVYSSTNYTADGSATVAEITAGVIALINATAVPVTAVDNTTNYTLVADNSGDYGAFTIAFTGTGTQAQAATTGQGASLAVGKLVIWDPTLGYDRCARLPTASANITASGLVAGVVVADDAIMRYTSLDGATQTLVPGNAYGAVVRKGHIWVKVEQAVTPGQQAFVRYAAGGYGLGSFGNTTGTSERAALVGSVYRSTAAIAGLAELEVNITQ